VNAHRRPARRALIAVGALGAAAALSACSAPRPGAAATVGKGRIAISELADRVDALLAVPALRNALRVNLQRAVLAELINDRIDDQVAMQNGVSVTATEIRAVLDSYRTETGAKTDAAVQAALLSSTTPSGANQTPSGYAGLQSYARDNLLVNKLRTAFAAKLPITEAGLRSLYDAAPTAFNSADLSAIVLTDQAKAQADYAKLVANPGLFADIAKIDSLSTQSAQNGGEVGSVPEGQLGPAIDSVIYAGKAGQILKPISDGGAFVILKINSLTVKNYEAARSDLISEAKNPSGAPTVSAISQERKAAATTLGVWVNPRFGGWAGPASMPPAGASPASVLVPDNPLSTVADPVPGGAAPAPSLFLPGSSTTGTTGDQGTTGTGTP